jgi:hypothetical protein
MAPSPRRHPSRPSRAKAVSILPLGVAPNVPTVAAPENPLRTGMPALDAIHARMIIASPQTPGQTYTVLRRVRTGKGRCCWPAGTRSVGTRSDGGQFYGHGAQGSQAVDCQRPDRIV